MPTLDDPDFDRKMAKMERLVYMKTMASIAGGNQPPRAAPVQPRADSVSSGLSGITKSLQDLQQLYAVQAQVAQVVQANTQQPTWLKVLDTKAGEALGLVVGRVLEAGIASMDRRAQFDNELKLAKMKADAKPAPSADAGGGFDLFGDNMGAAEPAAPAQAAAQSAPAPPPASPALEQKVNQLSQSVEQLAQMMGILAQRAQANDPAAKMRTFEFACKSKGCSHKTLIVAPNESAASGSFKSHLTAHPEFVDEAKAMAAEGVTPQKAATFASSWVAVTEVKEE
jgi:hypothetical protein